MTHTDTLTAEQAGAAILRLALERDTPALAQTLGLAEQPSQAVLAAFLMAAHLLRSCEHHEMHATVASRLALDLYQEQERT